MKSRSNETKLREDQGAGSARPSASQTNVSTPAEGTGWVAKLRQAIARRWDMVVVLALAILVWAPRLTGQIDLRYDAGVYYLLGSSLASGDGYRIPSEPGSPEALQYPPLLPAIIAIYQSLLGTSDPIVVGGWLRKSYFLLYLTYGVALLALAKKYLRPVLAVLATALCLVYFETIFLSDLLFAELPFALIGVCFALVAGKQTLLRPWLRETSSFLLAAAGFLLRSAGLALLAAWPLEALMRRQWRLALLRGAVALVPVVAWQVYVSHVRGSEDYAHPAYEYQRAPYQYYNVSYAENMRLVDPFRPELGRLTAGALATRLLTNVPSLLTALGEGISARGSDLRRFFERAQRRLFQGTVIPGGVAYLPILGLTVLILAGVILLVLRGDWLIVFIFAISLGLVWTTPWPGQYTRYLVPLSPFLAIPAVLALSHIRAWQARKSRASTTLVTMMIAGVFVLTFAMQAYPSIKLVRSRGSAEGLTVEPPTRVADRLFAHDSYWQEWEEAVNWLGVQASPDAIIATAAPHWLYLRIGRRAVLPPMESDPARARHLLEGVPVAYVIVDQLGFLDISRRYARPAVENAPGWRLAQAFGGTKVYERAQ